MPTPPSGKIVATPKYARACGCEQEFQFYAVDKFRAERLAKFQATRCPDCAAKLIDAQRQTEPIPQADAIRLIPAGSEVVLTRRTDGGWAGRLTAEGLTVEATGKDNAGPQAVVAALARLWLAGRTGQEG